MDPVRFGRALGIGARLAAKTAVTAVDAALAPNPANSSDSLLPRPTAQAASCSRASSSTTAGRPSDQPAPLQRRRSRPAPRSLIKAVTLPLRRLSGVLWLEFTGVFFGLFAAAAALGAWRLRSTWRPTPANATDHLHLLLTLAVAVLFSYFCATSFLRARRRSRQP